MGKLHRYAETSPTIWDKLELDAPSEYLLARLALSCSQRQGWVQTEPSNNSLSPVGVNPWGFRTIDSLRRVKVLKDEGPVAEDVHGQLSWLVPCRVNVGEVEVRLRGRGRGQPGTAERSSPFGTPLDETEGKQRCCCKFDGQPSGKLLSRAMGEKRKQRKSKGRRG